MDPLQLATLAAQYGFPAVILVILWLAYDKLVNRITDRLATLIEANTAAMQSMKDLAAIMCNDLARHDNRITGTLGAIDRIEGGVVRIEAKVNLVHDAVKGRRVVQ